MKGDIHRFDYNPQDRFVFYERKCNFRIALMYFKKSLVPPPPYDNQDSVFKDTDLKALLLKSMQLSWHIAYMLKVTHT